MVSPARSLHTGGHTDHKGEVVGETPLGLGLFAGVLLLVLQLFGLFSLIMAIMAQCHDVQGTHTLFRW